MGVIDSALVGAAHFSAIASSKSNDVPRASRM